MDNERFLLVVNDTEARLDLITGIARRFLKNQHIQILTAENGTIAMERATFHQNLCAALVDYEMPDINGIHVIRHIREIEERQHRQANALIALVTSSGGELFSMRSAEALEAGANAAISIHALNRAYRTELESFLEQLKLVS